MEYTNSQKQVIEQVDGRIIVIACPGSGKTTTILERTKHMLDTGVPADKILVVTFTKNAAEEMSDRFNKKYCVEGNVTFSTIHSLCFTVLRKAKGFNGNNILKEWEQYKFFSTLMKDLVSFNDMETFCKQILSEISYVKNSKFPVELFNTQCRVDNKKADFPKLYNAYEAYKQKENKVDFDDMLIMCNEVFQNEPAELEFWQDRFPYIMIDEFQDTNIIQSEIFYKMAEKHGNLCIVGDDDQSIYGFRSADSSIMLNFEKRFPDAKKIFLDTNYRSDRKIIDAAKNLISNNKVRFDKEFKIFSNDDGIVKKESFTGWDKEIDHVIKSIKKAYKKGQPYEDMAILYRLNKLAIPLTVALLEEDIPFHMKENVPDIHDEFVFKDIRVYYQLANNISDDRAGDIVKIMNHPSRYIKKDDYAGLDSEADMIRKNEQINRMDTRRRTMAERNIRNLFSMIRRLKDKTPEEFVRILFDSRYEDWIADYASFLHRDTENVMTAYEEIKKEAARFKTMAEWFDFADEYKNTLKRKQESKKGITLSTYHGSKGLEWDTVFLTNADKDITPYARAEEEAEIEEERRMFYVAATRAKHNLYISYVVPSQFITEMKI